MTWLLVKLIDNYEFYTIDKILPNRHVFYNQDKKLKQELSNQDLESIFELESDLFPCLVDMKFKGVRVNVQKAHKLKKQLASEEKQYLLEIKNLLKKIMIIIKKIL